jgi:nicotinate-nucleotide adenylyltransferase
MRVGVLGGTFDPVHCGHLAIAEEARAQLHLEWVAFVPAGRPPHKLGRAITSAHHRLAMLERALASNPYFRISYVDVDRSGPSYTTDTLALLRQEWGPAVDLYFIIGADSLLEMYKWYHPERIIQLAHLAVAQRPSLAVDLSELERSLPGLGRRVRMVQTPLLEISGTDLRRRVQEGRPIKYYVPEEVEAYIFQQGLYRNERTG